MTHSATHSVIVEAEAFLSRYQQCLAAGTLPPRIDAHLAQLLGCPYSEGDANGDPILNDGPVDVETKCARQEVLPKLLAMMRRCDAEPSGSHLLLEGLYRNNCWRRCLATEDGAYTLAVELTNFVDMYFPSFKMDALVAPAVLEILNDWLAPSVPWPELPGVTEICKHMFISAWNSLNSPGDAAWTASTWGREHAVENLILCDRPQFLPGLCPAQTPPCEVPLPDISYSLDQ